MIDAILASTVVAWLLQQAPHLIAAVALVAAGVWLGNLAQAMLQRLERQVGIDPMLHNVLATVARYAVLILFVVAAVGQLGFEMSSILAVLATAGLAVGLALQATLSNIAAGIMLLWLRPFKVGDQIEVGAVSGRVAEVGLFASEVHTADGVFQFVPNSELWNKRLVNTSRLPRRLVMVRMKLSGAAALPAIRRLLAEQAASDKRWLAEPKPELVIDELADDKITVTAQAWTLTEHHAAVKRELSDKLLEVISVALP